MSVPRIMAEAARHGITFEPLPDGRFKTVSKGKPPARIIAAIKGARDGIATELAKPVVAPDMNHCRHCGERINWATDGTAFADGNAAHDRCYVQHESERQRNRARTGESER